MNIQSLYHKGAQKLFLFPIGVCIANTVRYDSSNVFFNSIMVVFADIVTIFLGSIWLTTEENWNLNFFLLCLGVTGMLNRKQ